MKLSPLDALLLVMVLIWGSNYAIIKSAFADLPPLAFNAIRQALASTVFLILLSRRGARLERRDWVNVVALAVVGQAAYQLLFIVGLDMTSAANSALLLGCTPVFVMLMTAALGHETIALRRWAGVALSVAGIYLIVGRDAAMGGESLRGDLVMLGAVMCWSIAAVISKPVLGRQPPLVVTGYSMAIGTAIYTPFAWPALRRLAWSHVGVNAWLALVFSAAFALCVAYMIWYTAVQRLGNTRTSAYSNMVPMAAMCVGWAFFDEPIGLLKLAGAAAILLGVVLART